MGTCTLESEKYFQTRGIKEMKNLEVLDTLIADGVSAVQTMQITKP